MPVTDDKSAAGWLAAIAEPTRLALLRALAAGPRSVTELARAAGLEVVNTSHHLGVLKGVGLVEVVRDGRFMRHSLAGARARGTALELTHTSGLTVILPLS